MNGNIFYSLAVIIIVLSFNKTCGHPVGFRIVGGVKSSPGEFPWQVEFGYSLQKRFCGGTLITDRHIVSAGHCFQKRLKILSSVMVYLGVFDFKHLDTSYISRKIKKADVHPKYCAKYEHYDITLVTLNRPVKFTMRISPICFPPANQNYANIKLTVIGFGRLSEDGKSSSLLRKVLIPIRTNKTCIENLQGYPLKPHQLCGFWYEGKRDACQGDSGSSMTYKDSKTGRWYFVGIVSYGWGCAEPALPALYTRVDYFYNWIFSKIASGKFCTG